MILNAVGELEDSVDPILRARGCGVATWVKVGLFGPGLSTHWDEVILVQTK
jgi:hypothetical protein